MSEDFLFTTHVKMWGSSLVMLVPRGVRQHLGLVPRDLVVLRKVGRTIVMKRLVAGEVLPLSAEEAAGGTEGSGD